MAVMLAVSIVKAGPGGFRYASPLPGSSYHSPNTNIILRTADRFSESVLGNIQLSVIGDSSGAHTGRFVRSDDEQTLLFIPDVPFDLHENVTVRMDNTISDLSGQLYGPFEYRFTIWPGEAKPERAIDPAEDYSPLMAGGPASPLMNPPEIRVLASDNPSPGYFFLSNLVFNQSVPNVPHLLVVDNNGQIEWSRQLSQRAHDFKKQPNGFYTYFDRSHMHFLVLNSAFEVVDSFKCGNGYPTDEHELRVLTDGHALLMSYDVQPVRMDTIVAGGSSQASVIGLVIQELDRQKNVVFQWRSWDHFNILDATYINFTASNIDPVHGNAIDRDTDGHLLISSRHLDEITKINRETGEIIWRLGGKNNQFVFVADTMKFSRQHAVRRLPNGNILLFDNGNFNVPQASRVVEYEIDELQMTAMRVWSYKNPLGTYGFAMGYAQRLPNGNTVIGWGSTNPTVTEVRPNGEKALELSFPNGVFSYRAFKFDYSPTSADVTPLLPEAYALGQNYPNPFNPATVIPYTLAAAGPVRLTVYDLLGRAVRRLVDAPGQEAGSHTALWDGRDDSGAMLASGVFLYTLETATGKSVRRAVLLK